MSCNGKYIGRLPSGGEPEGGRPFSDSGRRESRAVCIRDERTGSAAAETEADRRLAKAFQTVCNILGYADQTEGRLREKLLERGYDRETADQAIERAIELGFLDEYRLGVRRYRYLAEVRLLGAARIRAELRQYGFREDTVKKLFGDCEELYDIDFGENCARLLRRRGGVLDRKNYAYLRGRGYSGDDIAEARRLLAAEEDD